MALAQLQSRANIRCFFAVNRKIPCFHTVNKLTAFASESSPILMDARDVGLLRRRCESGARRAFCSDRGSAASSESRLLSRTAIPHSH
eukprot:6020495-Pleurochrysis_carterae.AAC.1